MALQHRQQTIAVGRVACQFALNLSPHFASKLGPLMALHGRAETARRRWSGFRSRAVLVSRERRGGEDQAAVLESPGLVARFDHQVKGHAAPACGEVELVAVFDVTTAFDDDIDVRFEQADQFLAGRHRLAGQHSPFALPMMRSISGR